MISSYSLDQDVSSEAEDSESKSNSSAFSPWQSTSDHRSIEKVANDTIVQDETPEEDDINVDEDEDDIADHDDNDTTLIRLFTRYYLPITDNLDDLTSYYLIVLLVVQVRQHHGQTIYPTEKSISMNLFKILCIVTWAYLFVNSMVVEAVRGQKNIARTHFSRGFLQRQLFRQKFD